MKMAKDGSSELAPTSSKDEVYQAQQGTWIPLNKQAKYANIHKGSYFVVSFL